MTILSWRSYLANIDVANTIIAIKYNERLRKFRIFMSEYYGLDSIDKNIKQMIKIN